MASLFELFDPKLQPGVPRPQSDAMDMLADALARARAETAATAQTAEIQTAAAQRGT